MVKCPPPPYLTQAIGLLFWSKSQPPERAVRTGAGGLAPPALHVAFLFPPPLVSLASQQENTRTTTRPALHTASKRALDEPSHRPYQPFLSGFRPVSLLFPLCSLPHP